MAEVEAVVERTLRADPRLVWAYLADTNRWDRAQGLSPARYAYREFAGKRRRVATARELGFEIEWIEPPYEWVEGQHVFVAREFLKGPLTRAGFRATVTATSEGARVRASSFAVADSLVGKAVLQVLRAKQHAALERYLDLIESMIPSSMQAIQSTDVPLAQLAHRRLLERSYESLASGPRSDTNESELLRRARTAREIGGGSLDVEPLLSYLRQRADEELAQIRPFELAALWAMDRRDALRLFLRATHAGLLDLKWQVNCPVCRVGAHVADHMSDLRRSAHCDACNIEFDLDIAKHVEAVFRVSEAIRRVETKLYCASSPSFLPHVFAQLSVRASSTRVESMALPASIQLRTLEGRGAADASFERPPAELHVDVGAEVIRVAASGESATGLTTVTITSSRKDDVTLLIERAGWSADVVLGTVIACFPEFVQLFATEAPATGVDLAVSHVALLFTDLTGSTACYERLGDARAFALVQKHFETMGDVVETHGGAVIKTMGDAVMASFPTTLDAVRAGLAMIRANEPAEKEHGLGVKVGVHAGPCLLVRANDRIDYFGTTANVAARVQAQANSGELVVATSLLGDAGVESELERRPRRAFSAVLKGISAAVDLVGIQPDRAD